MAETQDTSSATTTTTTGKVLRGRRAKWIRIKNATTNELWTLIGVRMDSESTNLNPQVDTGRDVTGAPFIDHSGFSPESDIEYLCRSEDSIFPHLQKISNELLKDDDSITFQMIVATLDKEVKDATGQNSASGTGYQVDVVAVPQNDGGDTKGYQMSVNFYETGGRTQGTVTVSNKQPSFTPASSN